MKRLTRPAIRFLLAALACASTRAADVTSYDVVKGRAFIQTNTGSPTLQMNNPFFFNPGVDTRNANNTLISATVTLPSSSTRALTDFQNDGASFSESFATQAALDAVYGSGNYTFTINTLHDNPHTGLVLSLSGDNYPNPPHIRNFPEAQRINPNADFVLKWDAFTNGTANDFLFLQINGGSGTVFNTTVNPADAGALDGTVTSLVIASNTLAVGQSYSAILFFAKLVRDTNSYPGVLGFAAYGSGTAFTINAPPRLDFVPPFTNGQFRLRLTGAPGTNYTIQVATNLTTSWISLFTSNSASGTFQFVDTRATNRSGFYRVINQ